MNGITETVMKGSKSFQRLNAHLLAPSGEAPKIAPAVAHPKAWVEPKKGKIRQNANGLNKTEQAFYDELKLMANCTVFPQSITLKLANGLRYTPDFMLVSPFGTWWAYETKGFMRDDANAKLKMAAAKFPMIKFHLVTRKAGQWQVQTVLP